MAPITNYSAEIQDPANIEETLANAFAASQGAKHGVAFVSVPQDIDDAPLTDAGLPAYQPVQAGLAPLAAIKSVAKRIKVAQFPILLVGLAGVGPERSRSVARAIGTNGVAGCGNLPSGGGRDAGTGPDVLLWADWSVPQSSRGPAFAAKRFSRYDWLRRN